MSKNIFLTTVGILSIGWSGASFAQISSEEISSVETDRDQVSTDDIVVTGFRQSLARAISIKRNEATVSDVIAADDIGKYPDTNIADSLQRVTGVQITRDRGQGGTISVRGLAPSFVNTQLNGRTLLSGDGRTFSFLAMSPDFVNSVVVQKSPTAAMLDGGLSATVDIRTPRPLDIGRTAITLRAEGTYDSQRKKIGPRASAVANYVSHDGTFGVNIGAGYEQTFNRSYSYVGYGAETGYEFAKQPNVDYNVDGDTADIYAFDHAQSYYVSSGERKRYSAILGVQWKPSDGIELYADGFYSRFKDNDDRYDAAVRYTGIAPGRAGAPFGVRSSTIDTSFNDQLLGGAQGFLTRLSADGVDMRADRQPVHRDTRIASGAVGAKLDLDRVKINMEADYSSGKVSREVHLASAIARASVEITRPDGIGGLPQQTFIGGFDPLDAENFHLVQIIRSRGTSSDRNYSGRINLSYDAGEGFVRTLRVGAIHSNRRLLARTFSGNISAAALASASGGQHPLNMAIENGSIRAAPFLTEVSSDPNIPNWMGSYLTFDYDKLFAAIPLKQVNEVAPYVEQLASRLDIVEKTTAAYAQVDFAGTDDRLTGNVGARLVNTRVVSKGFGADLDNLTLSADGVTTLVPSAGALTERSSYTYVLPSLNLRYDITDDFTARLAVARVLARPDFAQLGVGLTVNANVLSINAANPQLKPYLSDQIDLSFEYYLPHSGILSLTLFHKSIDNFIVNGQVLDVRQVRRGDGSTYPLSFRRNQPRNLANVRVMGLELGAQIPLVMVSSSLEGFGIFGNATVIDAPKVPAEQNGLPFPLPGVSDFSYNIGAYFERNGFGARAYYNWRGEYDTGAENYFGDRQIQTAFGQLDGSLSYNINDRIALSLDFENILNREQRQVNNFGLARGYLLTGRRITLGVSSRF